MKKLILSFTAICALTFLSPTSSNWAMAGNAPAVGNQQNHFINRNAAASKAVQEPSQSFSTTPMLESATSIESSTEAPATKGETLIPVKMKKFIEKKMYPVKAKKKLNSSDDDDQPEKKHKSVGIVFLIVFGVFLIVFFALILLIALIYMAVRNINFPSFQC